MIFDFAEVARSLDLYGYAIVPRKPTRQMLEASMAADGGTKADEHFKCLRAAIEAEIAYRWPFLVKT